MKKSLKILFLALALTLLCSSIFAIASMAADETDDVEAFLKELGATRTAYDYTGDNYDKLDYLNFDQSAPSPKISIGKAGSGAPTTGKFGRLRTVTYAGNTFYEWISPSDAITVTSSNKGSTDMTLALLSTSKSSTTLANSEYIIHEFDMATRTDFPGNINIIYEGHVFDGTSSYRSRASLAQYNDESNRWVGNAGFVEADRNQWSHITIVIQMNEVVTTADDGTSTYNYGTSQARAYWNGQLISTFKPFVSKEDTSRRVWINFCGIGYNYGSVQTGRKAGDSVAYDNNTITTFSQGTAALDALFAAENPATNLSGLTHEDVYSVDYNFPSEWIGAATVTDAQGNVTNLPEFKDAMAFVKENRLTGATITLYGREYEKVLIDYPVNVNLNGFAFLNGYDLAYGLTATETKDGDTLTAVAVTTDKALFATFNVYNKAYAIADATPTATEEVSYGALYNAPSVGSYLVGTNTVYVPTGAFEVRDSEGKVVTLTAVGEENLGKTYSVYPVMNALTSTVENPTLYVKGADATYTFYASNDITAALGTTQTTFKNDQSNNVTVTHTNVPEGATVVLLANVTYSTTFSGVGNYYLDLNGYTMYAGVSLHTSMVGSNFFFYSSRPGARITTGSKPLVNAETDRINSRTTYLGYIDANTPSENRISIFVPYIVHQFKGTNCKIFFYNCDVYNTKASSYLMAFNWGRDGRTVEFNNCNIYTLSNIHNSTSGSASSTVIFRNSNIYGTGTTKMCSELRVDAGGTQTTHLENTNVYGMTIGEITNANGMVHNINVIGDCILSFVPVRGNIEGTCVPYPSSVTFSGIFVPNAADPSKAMDITYAGTYTAAYISTARQYANINFYYEMKENATATTPVYTTSAHFYGEGIRISYANLNLLHKDVTKVYVPVAWEFYDVNGKPVELTTIQSNNINETYYAYLKTEVMDTAYSITDADGNEFRSELIDLGVHLNCSQVPAGTTVKLYQDCYVSETIKSALLYFDLNGKSLYTQYKTNMFDLNSTGAKTFIYSSAPGARICVTPNIGTGSGYFAYTNASNAELYIGYKDANTKSENRIDIYSGALISIEGSNNKLYIYNCNLVHGGVDNYGYINFRGSGNNGREVFIENCDIYNSSTLLCARGNSADNSTTGDAYFKDCRIFSTSQSAHIFNFYGDSTKNAKDVQPTVVFDNTQLYGGRVPENNHPSDINSFVTVIFKNNSTTSVLTENTKAEEGYVLVPVTENNSITIPGISVPAYGRYGAPENIAYSGTFAYAYKVVPVSEYLTTVYQNVTLDTNINVNTYIPVWDFIESLTFVGSTEDLLDRENIVVATIGTFYQFTLGEAPKDAYDTQSMVLTFKNGTQITFEASIGRYAKRLLELESDEAYTKDSQEMLLYVLAYIKEVALEFGGASAEDIFPEIENIAPDMDIPFTEATDLSTESVREYVTAATLDLDNYAGFAFAIAKDFVGTVRISLGRYAVKEMTFTADAPALGDEVLVLSNIPAYALRDTITIDVTTAEGELKTATFNLATYVTYFSNKAYAKAVYAYSVKAGEYVTKYPVAGTLSK